MKGILESPAVLEAYIRIDLNYNMLQKLYSDLFESLVYDRQILDDTVSLLEEIIKDKEFIEADTVTDKEILEKVKELKSKK